MGHRKWTMQQLTALVEAEVSLREIERTCGADHRTVKRYFPDYKPFRRGGWRDEGGAIRQVNMDFREFERTGKITTEDEKQAKRDKLEALRKHDHDTFVEYGRLAP